MEKENKFDIVHFILGVLISIIVNGIGIQLGLSLISSMGIRGDLSLIFVIVPFILNWLTYMIVTKSSIKKGVLFGFLFSIFIAVYFYGWTQVHKGSGTGWY